MERTASPVGELLREWRQRRRVSQLDLALDAEVSARHISFLETGRSRPSQQMVMHLAEHLDVPLRERNRLLLAAGYAPVYHTTPLDDPMMQVARGAVDHLVTGHEPFPAIAVDRHWNLVKANRPIGLLLTGVASELLEPPINVLRLSLHPAGLAPRILNLDQWRHHLLARLRREIEMTADPVLVRLYEELGQYPEGDSAHKTDRRIEKWTDNEFVVPLRIQTEPGLLSFFSATTIFGTANDVTLSELTIESFFPADAATAEILQRSG